MTDARFMARALALGRRGLGRTAPNPAVGCVIVSAGGEIIGEGWHHQAGKPHAEVEAIRSMAPGVSAQGATAFVTLEPCNHTGRTAPCSEALIAAGVARVVISVRDPNPGVGGGGVERLRTAGVDVIVGLLEGDGTRLLAGWASFITRGRPLVTLKVGTSLDGRIATQTGDSQWVTGDASRAEVHRMRDETDAILVGAGTVRADNPRLTARIDGGVDPLRVVVSSSLELPDRAHLLTGGPPTIILCVEDSLRAESLRARGVDVLPVGSDAAGQVDLEAGLKRLGQRGITSLMVEGGRGIATSLLAARLVDRLVVFVAPKVIGGDGLGWAGALGFRTMAQSIRLEGVRIRSLESDVCIEGECVYGDH